MSEARMCPTCGRPLPQKQYAYADAQRVFNILSRQPDGYIYKSQRGSWHITRVQGKIDPRLVETMVITGDLHDYYKDRPNSAYTLSSRPQIDIDALMAQRAAQRRQNRLRR